MSNSLNRDLVRVRYALESVAEEDREAIVRLVETAACVYGEQDEAIRTFAFPDTSSPIVWRGE